MDALSLFRLRHQELESFFTRGIFASLTDEQLRSRPHPAVNSIVWLVWHIARGEDWGVNRLVVDRPQVWEQGQWPAQLGMALDRIGTGMADDEVGELSRQVDIAALKDYWRAVRQRTDQVAEELKAEDLDLILGPSRLRQVVLAEGAFGDPTEQPDWVQGLVTGFYANRPKGWFLTHFALTHPFGHYGEAGLVRGLLLDQ